MCSAGEKCIFLHAHVAAVGQRGPGQKQDKGEEPEAGSDTAEGWDKPKVRGRLLRRPKAEAGLVVLPLACSAIAAPACVAAAGKRAGLFDSVHVPM